MLELKPLESHQYKQVAEWEWGPQPEGTDWGKYCQEMDAPQWQHFGLYNGPDFVGCVSFEQIDRQTMSYHVVTGRHKVHPRSLAQVLLNSAPFFFRRGFTSLVAHIPKANIAAARLAIRCGMREWGHTPTLRYFILTKQRYLKNGFQQTETGSSAFSAAAAAD